MTDRTIAEIGEAELIARFAERAIAPFPEVIVENGDDAAAFLPRNGLAVVTTTDALVEGVHFELYFSDPRSVGRKLVSVNLSDLAAMGAEPRYMLLSACLPRSTPLRVVEGIAEGVRSRCAEFRVHLFGGNVSRTSGPIVLSATLLGEIAPDRVMTRRGSVAGDAIWVTGSLGDARAGLELVRTGKRDEALTRALVDPTPRVAEGIGLAKSGLVHAACDLSDGLGRDLRRLLMPLGLGAEIDPRAVPISRALLASGLDPVTTAVEGGEDYELLFTAPIDRRDDLARALGSTALTLIGRVVDRPIFELVEAEGERAPLPGGFDHFAHVEDRR
jgi:thiamine-monophosphate kinase